MGDFQDVFGAGADSVRLMETFARQEKRSSSREKANQWGLADDEREETGYQDELDAWRNAMSSRGYTSGPRFSTYEELSEWDRTNKRPHVRRRNSDGFEVYFTDKVAKPLPEYSTETQEETPKSRAMDNPPF